MKTRIYFLDNLRTFMILLVIVLHAGIVYEPILENIWIVTDTDKNSSLGLMRMYLDIFVMFTLFFISGYFIPNSLRHKNNREFIFSKFRRIMIPWIVAVFTLIPLYKVIYLYSRGLAAEEWYSYFHLFSRYGGDPGSFADNPSMSWLWFLPILFIFQIAYLLMNRAGLLKFRISLKQAVPVIIILSIVYSMLMSKLGLSGWYHSPLFHFQTERLLPYFMVFLLGSLCNKLNVFDDLSISKRTSVLANVVLTISVSIFSAVALNLFFNMVDPGRNYFFVSPFIDKLFYHGTLIISMFCFLFILLTLFHARLNKTTFILRELSSNSYFVYIIHLPVIGVFALILLPSAMPALIKFCILVVSSFIVSNILVSLYRSILQRPLSNRLIRNAVLPLAILLSIAIYSQNRDTGSESIPVIQVVQSDEPMSLQMAAIKGNTEAVQWHIDNGTSIDEPEPTNGSTALITASLFGNPEVVQMLLKAGANINYQNNDGSTALHTAAFFCRKDIVQILLDFGADKEIKNKSGATALISVQAPYEAVEGIYQYFANSLGPLGLVIDYAYLKETRPQIANMLK